MFAVIRRYPRLVTFTALGRCVLAIILGFLAGCASGDPAARTAGPPPAPAPPPTPARWGGESDLALGPLLWQVDGRGGAPLFLFGTMHTEPAASVPPAVWERLFAARTLAVETDLAALGPQTLLEKALLPPGESLDALLGADAWVRFRDYLKDTVPEPALLRLQPWFVVSVVLVKASGMKPDADPMDLALVKRGRDAGKAIRFLERPEQQVELLSRTFDGKAVAALATSLDALPVLHQRMTAAYRRGDVGALEAVLADAAFRSVFSNEQLRFLLGARNERWVPFIETLAADGDTFVAVGAGHLPGPDGLVALLRARGYRVTRVPVAR